MRIKDAGNLMLDLLYPRRCPVCGEPSPVGLDVCPECEEKLPYVKEPLCRKCGKPVDEMQVFCTDCMEHPHEFAEGRGVFIYDDVMRESITYFKYIGRKEYGQGLGKRMAEYAEPYIRNWQPERIVPVPVHESRKRARGYNQAEVLARAVAAYYGIPCALDAIIRTGKTAAMKNLSAGERRKNLLRAFSPGPGIEAFPSVLLVDDIYTTGATLDACAAVLRDAGTREVYFLTACIGAGAAGEP